MKCSSFPRVQSPDFFPMVFIIFRTFQATSVAPSVHSGEGATKILEKHHADAKNASSTRTTQRDEDRQHSASGAERSNDGVSIIVIC